jgi:hypothetical protein
MAADLTDRVCYGLELDPRHVDVTIDRWQKFTGKTAALEADGRTFDKIKAARQVGL